MVFFLFFFFVLSSPSRNLNQENVRGSFLVLEARSFFFSSRQRWPNILSRRWSYIAIRLYGLVKLMHFGRGFKFAWETLLKNNFEVEEFYVTSVKESELIISEISMQTPHFFV